MGVIYMVSCRDCRLTRDLSKFYSCRPVKNREEALQLSEQIGKNSHNLFAAALLASFMSQHMGHNCTVFTDLDPVLSEELDPIVEKTKEDVYFWYQE